jgi:hypothetical protein
LVSLDLDVVVASSRMVECAENEAFLAEVRDIEA